jgi:hypothetical protein
MSALWHDVMAHAMKVPVRAIGIRKKDLAGRLQRRDDSMRTVEIRWKEVAADDKLSDFNSYLKEMEDADTPSAVEEGFSSWLKEHVEGRKIIVSDMEIFVDGKHYHIGRGNEADAFYKRLKEASGR